MTTIDLGDVLSHPGGAARRPDPPAPIPGRRWEAHPADDLWRVDADRICRKRPGPRPAGCPQPSVLALNRGRSVWVRGVPYKRPAWWGYCAEHAAVFFRWVEDGRVMEWRAVADKET